MADQIDVLIVDDDRDIAETLGDILVERSYRVDFAASFRQALQRASARRYDVVLVDVRLPDAVGTDLLPPLRQINEDAAVIIITAFASVYSSIKAIEHGATAYMLKPLDVRKLVETIESAVRKKRLEAENRRMLRQLTAINSVAAAVNQSLDLATIVSNTVTQMKLAFEPDAAWIFLVDTSQKALVLQSHYGLDKAAEDLRARPLRIGEDLVGKVAESGQPIFIAQRGDRDPHATRLSLRELQCNALAAVPITAKNNVLGVLGVAMCGDNSRRFVADDTSLLEGMAGQVALAIENARLYHGMEQLAMEDELTGLSNRRYFFEELEREIARAKRHRHTFGLIMLDLDNFKALNDRQGHLAGDAALQRVATLARAAVRESDVVGRYGGEEFVILLPETNEHNARDVAERLRQDIATMNEGTETPLTMSAGIAIYPTHGQAAAELVRQADSALYQAKRAGKNRVMVANEGNGESGNQ